MAQPSFLDNLACALCKEELEWAGEMIRCLGCGKTYGLLARSGAPVLLPDPELSYDIAELARAMKAHVRDRFAMIDEVLPKPFGSFATFLNLGYVSDGSPEHAVRGPDGPVFNRNSVKLLFEVIGPCPLDDRVVFELGAGRGGNVAMINGHFRPKVIVGLDLSMVNVEFCEEHHVIEDGGFAVADVEHLPVRTGAVDVVLNLESSHYYPDIDRFFNQVHRILVANGDFLYADILRSPTFEWIEGYLVRLGFEIVRNQDVSSNVMLSCESIARIREERRHTGLYETFDVVPGSSDFEALREGRKRYKILHLRKVR